MAYDPTPQANAMAAVRFDPQMAAINRQIEDLKAQTQSNNAGIDVYNTEGNAGINKNYDTLGGLHADLATRSDANIRSVGDQIGQTWKDATAVQQANQSQNNKQLSDYADRFGIQGSNLPVMSQLDAQIQKMINTNTTQGATQQGASTGWMGAQKASMDAWQGIDSATRAKQLGDFATSIMNARSANQLAGLKGQNDLYGRLNDTMGQRNAFLTDEMNQLTNDNWDREFKTNQAKWQADVENNRTAAQTAKDAKDESLGWARLMQEGITSEGQRLLGQQDQNTRDYTAHQPKEKPFNDLQVQNSIFQQAGGGNGVVPTQAQLEASWNWHKTMGLVDGINPYSPKKKEDTPSSNSGGGGRGNGFTKGVGSAGTGFEALANRATESAGTGFSDNPLKIPNVGKHVDRGLSWLDKLGYWGTPWSRGNPFG